MAAIEIRNNRFHVKIRRQDVKMSKTFDTEEEANAWADDVETRIKNNAKVLTKADRLEQLKPLMHLIPQRLLEAVSSIPFSLKEILNSAMPATVASGIYFLIRRGDVVYVGQSATDVLGRIAKHRRNGKEFDSYAMIHCEVEKLDLLEAHYITAFMPVLNFSLGRINFNEVNLENVP